MSQIEPKRTAEEQLLVEELTRKQDSGEVTRAVLRTDDRVLARITDGIYRQPSSALRELISNAYDADSTLVVIHTDPPRFKTITIHDNGNGMDIDGLARLINHIGGSSKRRTDGAALGTTSESDPALSPRGRRLIGKIGIGLFSVAQLTRHFQIVTKQAGKSHRLIADVILKTYSEEDDALQKTSGEAIETGTVDIVSVPAEDVEAHGTDVLLLDLRPQSVDLLRSQETWNSVDQAAIKDYGVAATIKPPRYHIGRVDSSGDAFGLEPKLPWVKSDPSENRFAKLYASVVDELGTSTHKPKLEAALDNYLRTLWTLSLSAPVNYIDGHPFDMKSREDVEFYQLQNSKVGQADRLALSGGQSVRESLNLLAPERGTSTLSFRVEIDGVELRRPIKFHNLPRTSQALKKPIVFFGSAKPDLQRVSVQERGGELSFEAYFLWAPSIVPREHNGLLIRIGDASGTIFDQSFAKYQVAELTRLAQITAEIFVRKGLDAALNIDRESFNTSHPHYQYITAWVHRALRQITNTLKHLASEANAKARTDKQKSDIEELEGVVSREIANATGEDEADRVEVILSDQASEIQTERNEGRLALNATVIFQSASDSQGRTTRKKEEQSLFRQQIQAVAQILEAYGLLENLDYEQQENLLRAIVRVFSVQGGQ